MICPMCGKTVAEKDVTWVRGVAGHFECHRRLQSANIRSTLAALACGLFIIGVFIGAMFWFFREVVPK